MALSANIFARITTDDETVIPELLYLEDVKTGYESSLVYLISALEGASEGRVSVRLKEDE